MFNTIDVCNACIPLVLGSVGHSVRHILWNSGCVPSCARGGCEGAPPPSPASVLPVAPLRRVTGWVGVATDVFLCFLLRVAPRHLVAWNGNSHYNFYFTNVHRAPRRLTW